MTSVPVTITTAVLAPLRRGDCVRVRAGNLLRGVNAWRRGDQVVAIPAVVEVVLGGGNYYLRSHLIPEGFTAHRSVLEIQMEASENGS